MLHVLLRMTVISIVLLGVGFVVTMDSEARPGCQRCE